MFDYSDTIYTMAAMAIFSILALNTNQVMLRNNTILQETELEFSGITYAQEIIEQLRFLTFQELGDLHNTTRSTTTDYGELNALIEVVYVNKNNPGIETGSSDHRRVTVRVSSPFLTKEIRLQYVKNK